MRFAVGHGSVALFLVVAVLFCSTPRGWAETEYFLVPAFATSKNDGQSGGLIAPILFTDPDGDLRGLVAPMFIQNSFTGSSGTLNVFGYGHTGQQFRLIGTFTEKIERELSFIYEDPAFAQGRFALNFGAEFIKKATARFYGFTQDTPKSNETNYTERELGARWQVGVYLNEVTQIAVGQRFRDVKVQPGVTDDPFTLDRFPGVDGGDGASIIGHRVTFKYDTRNNLVTPTDGMHVMAYAELNQNLNDKENPTYYRYELEVKKLFPSRSKRVILVVRGDLQATFGERVPFYERSSLGGRNNLRGYGEDRFIDKQLLAFNVEQRIHVLRVRMFNVMADFEVTPFVDVGRVFNTFPNLQLFTNFEVTPGLGMRGLVRPSLVGRVDYAYSSEGGAVFAGLDYPF